MIKKNILLFFLLIFLFSGCVEIVEEITVNPDKSGTICFYIDLGALGGLAMNMGDKYMQGTLMEQLKTIPAKSASILKEVKGLKNIKSLTNKNGLYKVSFDFENPKQLNDAIYNLLGQKKRWYEPKYMKIGSKKLVKKNYAPVLRMFANKYKTQMKDKSLMKTVSYKTIFHLPDEVKNFSNKKSIISADKKKLEFSCSAEELLMTNISLRNKIKY